MFQNDRETSRVKRSKEQARRSYDRLSRWYDLLTESSERRLREIGPRLLCTRNGDRILEIGLGKGHGLVALGRSVGGAGKVTGIDLSAKMPKNARDRVASAKRPACVGMTCGDAETLPYPDGRFDAIFISFVLELFDTPEISRVLGECHRVLRPGGRLGVVALDVAERSSLTTRLNE